MTKDHDFLDTHLAMGVPPRLILLTLGNTRNAVLRECLIANLPAIVELLASHGCVELSEHDCYGRG